MKRRANALWILALFCVPSLAWAQIRTHWDNALAHRLPGFSLGLRNPMQVKTDQRTDLAKCMAATRQVQMIVDQMTTVGEPWSRGRLNYSRHDLLILSDREEALSAALITLTTDHVRLLKSLAQTHDRNVARHLQKLDLLRKKLFSGSSEIARDLTHARPGPRSPELSWDVYAVRKAAGNGELCTSRSRGTSISPCKPKHFSQSPAEFVWRVS